MGHYLSEMEGPPFTTSNVLYTIDQNVLKWAEEYLKEQKLEFTEVVKITEEWITENPDRCWINILYKSEKHKGECIVQVDYEKYTKFNHSKFSPPFLKWF